MDITIAQAPSNGCVVVPFLKTSKVVSNLQSFCEVYHLDISFVNKHFKAEAKQVFLQDSEGKVIFLLGIGNEANFGKIVKAFHSFSHKNKTHFGEAISVDLRYVEHGADPFSWEEAAVNGLVLGLYDIGAFKSDKQEISHIQAIELIGEGLSQTNSQIGVMVGNVQKAVFDLVNKPSNYKTPQWVTSYAQSISKEASIKFTAFDKKECLDLGLHALLAVGQGSPVDPSFVLLEYAPDTYTKTVGLVGKGVTFDTGGVSIKPSTNMHMMKSDMAGAAAVLGAIECVARAKLPIRIVAAVPLTENSVDANSIRPGDVISSYLGKTIEVIDTDAEGRLILADALAYLNRNFKPDYLVDLATLTGAVIQALGYHAAGVFSTNEQLLSGLAKAGVASGEKVWPLPLWSEYEEDLKSDVADLRNYSNKPVANAISAAKFLEVFTEAHPAWAHIDIAGVAFADGEFSSMRSATGYGVRLLFDWLTNLSESEG